MKTRGRSTTFLLDGTKLQKTIRYFQLKISEVVELFGRYLKVKFLPLSDDPMSQKKSAFAVLLEAREKMKLPQRPNENNKRDVLTKLFIDWLDGLELGFSPDGKMIKKKHTILYSFYLHKDLQTKAHNKA